MNWKKTLFSSGLLFLMSMNSCITPVQQEVGAEKESTTKDVDSNKNTETSNEGDEKKISENEKSVETEVSQEISDKSESIPLSQTNVSTEMASSESKGSEIDKSSAIVVNVSTMALIRSGCFQMDSLSSSKPGHKVCLKPFFMDKKEVTQAEFKAVTGSSLQDQITLNAWGDAKGEGVKFPMYFVSWQEAFDYCQAVGKRLPTSAQWEFAALGGLNAKSKTSYSGSNNIDDVAWYKDNANGSAHEVGLKTPNALGIYDMSGNVLEWSNDWYGTQTFDSEFEQDPQGVKEGSYKVVRGGGWNNQDYQLKIPVASGNNPEFRSANVGFRCAY